MFRWGKWPVLCDAAKALAGRLFGKKPEPAKDDIVSRMLASSFAKEVDFSLVRLGINAGGLLIGAELYDLHLHSDVEAVAPQGAYIRGIVGPGTRFEPTSALLGDAVAKAPVTDVTRGWVELRTLNTHRDMEAVAPIRPYVHGSIDEERHFYPDEPFEIVAA